MSFLGHTTIQLLSYLLQELHRLVSNEIELAKLEISEMVWASVRHSIKVVIGMVAVLAGFLVLLAAAVYGLATVIPMWLSALIIGCITALAGVIYTLTAWNRLKKMKSDLLHPIDMDKQKSRRGSQKSDQVTGKDLLKT